MKHILALIRRDLARALSNPIAIVVMAGIIAVPSFYAWFNIAGSWDPYGSTDQLRVAVANDDEGYEGELVPVRVNLGDRVVSALAQSDSMGYVPTSREKALEGVRSGAYYAAIVIPKNFSARLMGAFSADAERAQVSFVQNEKANAIAQIVTDKAGTAVARDIKSGFVAEVTDVGAGAAAELSEMLDDNELVQVADALDGALSDGAQALRETAGDARSFAKIAASAQQLLARSGEAFQGASDPLDHVGDALAESANGLGDVSEGINGAAESVDSALADAQQGISSVENALDGAFSAIGSQTDDLAGALADAQGAVDDAYSRIAGISASAGKLADEAKGLENLLPDSSAARAAAHEVAATLGSISERLQDLADELKELSGVLKTTAGDLSQGKTDAQEARQKLAGLVAAARNGIDSARDAYNSSAHDALTDLEAAAADAAETIGALDSDISSTQAAVSETSETATSGLAHANSSLAHAADRLEEAADGVDGIRERLQSALASSDLAQIREILAAGPTSLASFMAQPVSLERNAVFPVENNGSAMAPFYTALSIWIGGVVTAALVRAIPERSALAETGCTRTQGYLGRLALFASLGLLQTALICAGDLLFLRVQCAHPALFVLAAAAASLVFVNIIYALTASFGDVGKAVAVVLMVLQVAGSGGTFPAQMLPAGFQAAYAWLPFVHVENALRAAMFGIWNADFWMELGITCAYLVPALLLGLVLRRPIARLTEWMEEQLESTHVM